MLTSGTWQSQIHLSFRSLSHNFSEANELSSTLKFSTFKEGDNNDKRRSTLNGTHKNGQERKTRSHNFLFIL